MEAEKHNAFPVERLIRIIEEIAQGNYSNDIMPLTTEENPKPVRIIAEAMGMMMVKVEAREYELENMVEKLRELNQQIKENTVKTVAAMANALGARDAYTEGHTARVGELAHRMAIRLGMDEMEAESVRLGGILHDIGKIGFSDLLFQAHENRNSSPLVKEIVRHPGLGAEILKDLDFLGNSREYVYAHHERLDGKGYPRRLKADEIALGARILAVADTYDAMTTDRVYQKGRSPEVAIAVLRQHAGTRWDEACIDALESVLSERGVLPSGGKVSDGPAAMKVRTEASGDEAAVRTLNVSVFDTPAEADLVDTLRNEADPVVSLIAEENGSIVGQILFSPVSLTGHPRLKIMGLGPVAVASDRRHRGIGEALVWTGLEQCRKIGCGAVVVLGHPDYYPRFGFGPASRFGLSCDYDIPEEAFMALELEMDYLQGLSGKIAYHPAFNNL